MSDESPPAVGAIHHRLLAIIEELPAIGKDAYNEQQKFHYRSHDDVLNALNPLLSKHGVHIVPRVIERIADTRTTRSGSTMYEVNLHVEFTFWAVGAGDTEGENYQDGDRVVASAWGEGTDLGDKATNKAMTGAFKNVLAQVFAISTGDTVDADSLPVEETTRGGAQRPSQPRQGRSQEPRAFDPGKDLLPGAIFVRNEDDATSLRQAQRDLDATQDWPAIEDYLQLHVFEKRLSDGGSAAEWGEFWKRLANAVVKVDDLAGSGDFPPPSIEQITEGYAWAFKGVQLALVPHEPTSDELDQQALEAAAADA